jgi:hypothetical protein
MPGTNPDIVARFLGKEQLFITPWHTPKMVPRMSFGMALKRQTGFSDVLRFTSVKYFT